MNKRYVPEDRGTPHFDFLSGAFRLSSWKIPYFFTTMSFEEAHDSLHLVSELPGSESIQWKVEELYQRDIDWPRVESKILPYLNDRNQPQFFNSITIALLPFDENTQTTLDFTSDHKWKPPDLYDASNRFKKDLEVGPVSFGFWENWDSPTDYDFRSGKLRWNKDQLYGVAIDGQHRLAAIKSLVNSFGNATSSHKETRIPVVLLIFAPQLGFRSPENKNNIQIDLLRKLFIDLNKHAKSVSRARQILLDDRDPHAVCVRRLINEQLTDNFESLKQAYPRLPLSLVDWHTEQAKFDTGPYITTILGLDWIMSKVLETQQIGDFSEYEKIVKQVKQLAKILDISLNDTLARVSKHQKSELGPFSYEDHEFKKIANAFELVWAKPLCRILTEFSPYKELISLRLKHESSTLNFQHWYNLYEKKNKDKKEAGQATRYYRTLINRFDSGSEGLTSEIHFTELLEEIERHKNNNLSFTVVFQKALIEAFIEYTKIKSEHIEELSELNDEDIDFDEEYDFDDIQEHYTYTNENSPQENDDSSATQINERSKEFISAASKFVDKWPEVLNEGVTFEVENTRKFEVSFWEGTIVKPGGGIDYAQGAATRAKDLIFVVAALHLYDNETDPGPGSDFDTFWDICFSDNPPAICKRIHRVIKRYTNLDNRSKSTANRILSSQRDYHNYSEEELKEKAREEAYYRIRQIWDVLDL